MATKKTPISPQIKGHLQPPPILCSFGANTPIGDSALGNNDMPISLYILFMIYPRVSMFSFIFLFEQTVIVFSIFGLKYATNKTSTTYFAVKNIHGSICSNMIQNLQYGPKSHIGELQKHLPNNPKNKYWATPILSYWGSFIWGLIEMK
jgi:hypothetical protein